MSSVFRAGPQPRSCESSVPRPTSTAILREQCSAPNLNRDAVSSAFRRRTSTAIQKVCQKIMSERMSEDMSSQKECQKICQKECQKIYVTKNLKNATWPARCGQRNEKTRKLETRKPENENTFCRFRVFVLSCFSHLRASLIAIVRLAVVFFCFLQKRPSCFVRFRRFGIFAFSRFRVFPLSRFRVFVLFCECVSACCAKPCCNQNVRVQSAAERTASLHTSHMPKAVIMFVLLFQVLRNGLLHTCPIKA